MADVFISYKRADQAAVQRLVEGLRDQGVSVWWDQDIAPDAPWEATIERELYGAKAVIVAWSPAAASSENIKAEARWGRNQGRLVQVFIAQCEPPLFFGERQGVDLTGWRGETADRRFQTLVAAIRAVIAGESPPPADGSARARRKPWAISLAAGAAALAALGLIAIAGGAHETVCRLTAAQSVCRGVGLAPAASQPASDTATLAAQARLRLIQGVAGVWDRQDGACRAPFTIRVVTGEDNVTRLMVAGPGRYTSTGQVIAADNGAVVTRNITAGRDGAREQWEYRPDGDQMTAIDRDGVATALVRCASNR